MADLAASVLSKLKNKAKASGISYQQCLQLFFQEEFLRKLAASKYAENFVLKGGLFFLQRFELTGRMKDFYDIYYLSQTFNFDGLKLQTAIQETLQNRGTAYEKDSFDRVLALADDENMQTKWRYFLKTLGNPEISFKLVITQIQKFLGPVWKAILNESEFIDFWIDKPMTANITAKAWEKHGE